MGRPRYHYVGAVRDSYDWRTKKSSSLEFALHPMCSASEPFRCRQLIGWDDRRCEDPIHHKRNSHVIRYLYHVHLAPAIAHLGTSGTASVLEEMENMDSNDLVTIRDAFD